jgi:hypothetical protein
MLTRSVTASIMFTALLAFTHNALAQVLPEAAIGIKITLAKKPVTRPMTITYVPAVDRYYVADGGLGPLPGDGENTNSPCPIHVYSGKGEYLSSAKPGYDNRSIYFNANTHQLETVTYNASASAGFLPNSGVFALQMADNGDLKDTSTDISGPNPAFGGPHTMPAYDAAGTRYFAKQGRGNVVFIVELPNREKTGEILLDLTAAGAKFDDISDYYIAYTGIHGEELAVLDVDHKAILVFDISGKFIARSALPADMKLHSQNHISGLGYANGMFFVYHEREGEYGTYYGFRISDQSK